MGSQPAPLGAIVYGADQSAAADAVLASAARVLAALGYRLAGAVQHNPTRPDRCRCDMVLEDLSTGRAVAISEDRGPAARGCRLDPAALEQLVGAAASGLETGADLLIVNRFGKREAEGCGFRAVIEQAVTSGIPVLVAVSAANLDSWNAFAGGLDQRLEPNLAPAIRWCRSVLPPKCTAWERHAPAVLA
jgi:nucleoside-triphosphatase THEP1